MTRAEHAHELKRILANLNANNLTSQLSLNVLKMGRNNKTNVLQIISLSQF